MIPKIQIYLFTFLFLLSAYAAFVRQGTDNFIYPFGIMIIVGLMGLLSLLHVKLED